jgi:hypothetical protein
LGYIPSLYFGFPEKSCGHPKISWFSSFSAANWRQIIILKQDTQKNGGFFLLLKHMSSLSAGFSDVFSRKSGHKNCRADGTFDGLYVDCTFGRGPGDVTSIMK